MRRRLAIGAVVVLTAALVLELAAVPVATRVIAAVVGRCVGYETLELTSVARPVVPRLLLGRARDVELRATDVVAGPLRVADARLRLPEAALPWALGDPPVATSELDLRVREGDLERALEGVLPLGLPISVDLEPGVATVGTPALPLTVDVEVVLDDDGTVRLRPAGPDGELLERIGLGQRFPPGPTARVTAVAIGDDELTGSVDLEVVPGVGGGGGCDRPLGARPVTTVAAVEPGVTR